LRDVPKLTACIYSLHSKVIASQHGIASLTSTVYCVNRPKFFETVDGCYNLIINGGILDF